MRVETAFFPLLFQDQLKAVKVYSSYLYKKFLILIAGSYFVPKEKQEIFVLHFLKLFR